MLSSSLRVKRVFDLKKNFFRVNEKRSYVVTLIYIDFVKKKKNNKKKQN